MHEHGGLGVPVRLRADVDSVHHQIHFAAGLRELHQAPQDAGNPIHVFHSAVHRDLGAGRDGEPFQGNALRLGQIQSCEDAPAFWFGYGAQILARISQHQNAGHALGIPGGEVADDADDDVGFVLTIGTIDGDQTAFRVKIMLDKIAGGKFRPRVFRSGCEHFDDFVRIDEPALAHANDFLVVFGQRS